MCNYYKTIVWTVMNRSDKLIAVRFHCVIQDESAFLHLKLLREFRVSNGKVICFDVIENPIWIAEKLKIHSICIRSRKFFSCLNELDFPYARCWMFKICRQNVKRFEIHWLEMEYLNRIWLHTFEFDSQVIFNSCNGSILVPGRNRLCILSHC